jgi:hypothetical protein
MLKVWSMLVPGTCMCSIALSGCVDSAESPSDRPDPPPQQHESPPAGSMLAPLDLVYICGNKFLVTNEHQSSVQVVYRVSGTDESGSLTLEPGVEEEPGYSETELETRERGTVELYQSDQLMLRR